LVIVTNGRPWVLREAVSRGFTGIEPLVTQLTNGNAEAKEIFDRLLFKFDQWRFPNDPF
jgi:predicted type IV restriction endonuclease